MSIELLIDKPLYKRYVLSDVNIKVYGYIILEKYKDGWNLELMQVVPHNKGYGTKLLKYVMNDMNVSMSVCPVSDESRRFFENNNSGNLRII